MKLLMVSNVNILDENSIGVMNKMLGQSKAFKTYGIDAHIIYNKLHIVIVDKLFNNIKIKIRPSSTLDYYNKLLELIEVGRYDVIYIRYPLSDYYFLNFLDSLKKINKRIKVLLDFPTYPYDLEINDKSVLTIDTFFAKYLRDYVDFGICYNKLSHIYGIPVFHIGNGINLESINTRNETVQRTNRIDLIAVANVAFWQAYDRIIEGLKIYYDNNNFDHLVCFNIVGLGSDIIKLTNLSNKYNLQKYINFHGYKSGEDLDKLFNNCDIGVGTLGMYRKCMKDGATLKAREYCARGIPFVLGYDDLDFPYDFKYAYKVTNDDTPININSIIEFYYKVYNNRDLVSDMRKYAEDNLTWEAKLKPIVDELMK